MYYVYILGVPLQALLPALWLELVDLPNEANKEFAQVLMENAQTFERIVVHILEGQDDADTTIAA